MRVLQVHSPYRAAGGEDRVVALEAEALRAAGHSVFQHIVPNPTKLLPTLGLLAQSPYNAAAARSVVAKAHTVGADIAHIHNTWFALSPVVVSALSRAGVPTVTTMHNYRSLCIAGTLYRDGSHCTDCLGNGVLPGMIHGCYENRTLSILAASTVKLHRILNTWTEHTDLILVPSETAHKIFLDEGYPEDRLRVKNNFTTSPGERVQPPSQSNTVLYVGRLRPEKGLEALLDAWRDSDHGDLELAILGDGPSRGQLLRRAAPGVRFVGARSPKEVAVAMLNARALVFPSLWLEPFGLTLIEAMAAALPVVGFRVADAQRIVGDSGLLVELGNVPELAIAIGRLADDDLVDRLGASGRQRFEAQFSPEVQTPALEDAYRQAIATSARRTGAAEG